MGQRPVIAAMLETGDSFLHLEQQEIDRETSEKLGYTTGETDSYSKYVSEALKSDIDEKMVNYHTVAEKLLNSPEILYREKLLRPQIHQKVEEHLELLRDNRDRSLNLSEIEAVINTTMEDEETFRRKAIDKEKLLDQLYIGLYTSPEEDVFHDGHTEIA